MSIPQLTIKEIRYNRIVALVTFTFMLMIGTVAVFTDTYFEEQEDVEEVIELLNKVHREGRVALDQLVNIPMKDCSTTHINLMRDIVKNKFFIKNITFDAKDGSHCSTSYGLSTLNESDDDIDEFTLNSGQNQSILENRFVSVIGQYKLEYLSHFLQHAINIDHDYEAVYIDDSGPVHLSGKRDLFVNDTALMNAWLESGRFLVQECTKFGTCVVFGMTFMALLEDLALILVMLLITCAIGGYLAFVLINKRLHAKQTVRARVQRGIEKGFFFPLFQPIVDLNTQEVIGTEILARFKDRYGEIYPDTFIPVIRELDQTWNFTETLFNESISTLKNEYSRYQFDHFRVSINIFPRDIMSNNIGRLTGSSQFQDNPFQLVLEITEDEYLEDKSSHEHLAALEEHEIRIALDDFGTGYSNLKTVSSIHSHYLKVDRSFVNELENGSVRASLIPNIIEIAKGANLTVIAEGIETEQQRAQLVDLGIDLGQGYLFGKADTAQKLFALKQKNEPSRQVEETLLFSTN